MKHWLFIIVISLTAWLYIPLHSQMPVKNIKISKPQHSPDETSIAVNPLNPKHVVAGANLNFYYFSMDGGTTWNEGTMSSVYGVHGDPSLVFDVDGNLYYAHLSNPGMNYSKWLDRIVVEKSTTGGMSWSGGVGVGLNWPRQQDKEWLAVDITDSPYRNNIYMAWTEFDKYSPTKIPADSSRMLFSRSTDGGQSWSSPIRIGEIQGDCIDSDTTVEGGMPAVGPNGEVYVVWTNKDGIIFDKSLDGGASFGKDLTIRSLPVGWDYDIPGLSRCNGFPVICCDLSHSPYKGTIYIVWADKIYGTDDTDIFIIESTDGGSSWSEPLRVNNDSSSRHQFFPWAVVDQATGVLYVVFYDRRNTSGNATEVYMAKSTDGGKSFSNFRISDTSFTPIANVFLGDYIGVAAHNRCVYPIWTIYDGKNKYAVVAPFEDTTTTSIRSDRLTPSTEVNLYQNYPNPAEDFTAIDFDLPRQAHVTITVYDATGNKIETLINEEKPAGRHTCVWNTSQKFSGLYFYKIEALGVTFFNKCVLTK